MSKSVFQTNKRITPKDRNAIKGALRKAFARSELHHSILNLSIIAHEDAKRPRVKTWCKCAKCGKPDAKSYMSVDHIKPLIPVNKTFETMSLDDTINRLWCSVKNLQVLCVECHDNKTALERKQRKRVKTKDLK